MDKNVDTAYTEALGKGAKRKMKRPLLFTLLIGGGIIIMFCYIGGRRFFVVEKRQCNVN